MPTSCAREKLAPLRYSQTGPEDFDRRPPFELFIRFHAHALEDSRGCDFINEHVEVMQQCPFDLRAHDDIEIAAIDLTTLSHAISRVGGKEVRELGHGMMRIIGLHSPSTAETARVPTRPCTHEIARVTIGRGRSITVVKWKAFTLA